MNKVIIAVGIVVLFTSSFFLYVAYFFPAGGRGMGNLAFALIGYAIAMLGIVLILWGITFKRKKKQNDSIILNFSQCVEHSASR